MQHHESEIPNFSGRGRDGKNYRGVNLSFDP